jgi:hypothetical protein
MVLHFGAFAVAVAFAFNDCEKAHLKSQQP